MAYGATADLVVRIITKAEDAGAGFTQTQTKMDRFRSGLGKMAVPAAIAGAAVIKFGADAVSSASDLQQAMGGVEAVFGKNSATITKWAQNAATQVGLSQAEYANMASALGASLKNAGIPMDQVTKKTGEMIKMGADLAATYGGTTAEAVSALTGALRGEADPAERYGLALNATKVNAELAAQGLDKLKGKQATAAKAALIMKMAAEQAGGAVGQFRREADSAAGSQEIANAKWENAKASLGTALLPVVAKVTNMLAKLAGWMGKNTVATQIIIGVVGALAAAIFILIGAFKVYDAILRITKIEALATWAAAAAPVVLVIAAVAAVIAIFVLLYKKVKFFRDFVDAMWRGIKSAAQAVGQWLKQFWKATFAVMTAVVRGFIQFFKPIWRAAFAVIKTYVQVFVAYFKLVFNTLKSVARIFIALFKGDWRGAWSALKDLVRGFLDFFRSIFNALPGPVRDVIAKIRAAFTGAFDWLRDKFGGLTDFLTAPFDALLDVVNDIISAVRTAIDWIGKIKLPSVGGVLDKLNPFGAVPPAAPGVTRRGLGAVVPMAPGARATSGGGVTINVNGALDPESTARQIQRILAGHDRRVGLRA